MIFHPINTDLVHTFTSSNSSAHYMICDADDNLIYKGVAYRQPGYAHPFIYINRLVLSQLHINEVIAPSLSWRNAEATFSIVVKEMTGTVVISSSTYDFVYNWDYDNSIFDSARNEVVNHPATHEIAATDLIPISLWIGSGSVPALDLDYIYPDGSVETESITISSAIEQNDINTKCVYAQKYKNPLIKSNKLVVKVDGNPVATYKITDCNRYTLYYKNKQGGVDILPLNGSLEKSEDFNTKVITYDYNNSDPNAVGKRPIYNTITTRYKAKTRFMTDEEAANFAKHFISSPLVVMNDNVADESRSVIIDENSVQYNTFRNNGNHFVQYTFSFSLTQTKKVL